MWSLLSSALGTLFNGVANRRANKINQRNYEEVRRYNTPIAQMSRFRAAGLNPHLIYTQTNEADQRPEWKAPQYDLSAIANVPSELSTYQNMKESKSRVNNLEKQNNLLDEQILGLTIENRFKEDLSKKQLALISKQIEEIDKSIQNIDFEQEFKNRSLNNDSIKALWNFSLQYATLGLNKQQFDLEKEKFTEFKRQFNLTHKGSAFFDEFIKELARVHGSKSSDAVKILAKSLAEIFLSGFSS